MKHYLFVIFFLPVFIFSQNAYDFEIENKIKQIQKRDDDGKIEEDKTISLCNELYSISKKEGYKKGMLMSIVERARIYSNRSDNDECLKITDEGVALAEELGNYNELASLLECKGSALLSSGNLSDSSVSLSKALKAAGLIKNEDTMHVRKTSIYSNLVKFAQASDELYTNTGYRDSVLYFAKKNYAESLKLSDKSLHKNLVVGQAARLIGIVYFLRGNPKEGGEYLKIAENKLINLSDKRHVALLYLFLGHNEFEKGNNKKALEYYEKALQISYKYNSIPLLKTAYPALADYYKKTGDVKMELFYMKKSKRLNDSLSNINQNALITQSKNDINLINSESRFNYSILIILSITLGIILVSFVIFYFYRKKNNVIEVVEKNIGYPKNDINEAEITSLLEMAKLNDKQFLIFFQEKFPDLQRKLLKFPQLTSADLELCAYLKLNIQTKEIATYKKTSIGAVDNRKYRIRKKLNLLPEADLYKWINTIDNDN